MEKWLTSNKNILALLFAAICIRTSVKEGTSVISDFVKAIPIKARH